MIISYHISSCYQQLVSHPFADYSIIVSKYFSEPLLVKTYSMYVYKRTNIKQIKLKNKNSIQFNV